MPDSEEVFLLIVSSDGNHTKMSATGEKQYGLILPSKNKAQTQALNVRKLNPLLDSDDELEQDEECPLNWVEASLKKSAGNSGQQALQRRMLREAVAEDASVFQYDEVYDEIQASKTAEVAAKKQNTDKKPKYIHNILKHAEKRKLEGERRKERQVQKEREMEGEEFADKESFVTASYLKKMEELKQAEEKARLEELQEEQIDVMKHKNFGAFYNHIFKQKMGESAIKKEPEDIVIKKEPNSDGAAGNGETEIIRRQDDNRRQKHYRTQRDLSESPEREVRGQNKVARRSAPSSDSEEEEKVESYRERRERLRAAEDRKDKGDDRSRGRSNSRERRRERSISHERRRERSRSRERRRERSHSRERRREGSHSRERRRDVEKTWERGRGYDRTRERKFGRDRSQERERSNRGRHRSRSRDRHARHSRSRSPQRRKTGDRRSRSPQRRSRSRERVKIKEEPKSPDRRESTKENNKDEKRSTDKSKDGKVDNKSQKEGGTKVKKENEVEEKEKRMDRIRKLFEKRTVGEKFDFALQRYYERKAAREAQG